ncbi:unnamed protein product [Paramecium octaurelia]|uniref:WD domain, G-beta repeat protein n=1 Tax=Paramecium octaurelia TaxID=43137 RepID=A0A8S1XET9_PAROT|nr:unnamed protein product [Paramecium octaurelia]
MFQSKMIELEEQFNCSQNHKQPILMVLLDKNLKREERLLCAICMENIEAETKIIGFKKVLQLIEENQKNKAENIQSLIKVDVDLVEQFVTELRKLQSKIIQQFDELMANSTEWINNLNLFGQRDSKYSFYDELDVIIENKMQNSFDKGSIIDQIKSLNNSFSNKINSAISVLRNEKLYSQCEKILINLNLIHHMKLIDNSIKQQEICYAMAFNQSGSLMISASNSNIKLWSFDLGKLNEISKFNGHTNTICCLQFSKNSNSFLSAGHDKSMRCWEQINQKEWKSSLPYTEHTDCIDCLIMDQAENQLVSGGLDKSIKIWKINFTDNELTYLYSLNKHTNNVYSLCFNESEDTLISCGGDKQIIIWKKDSHQIWQFGCVVTQLIDEFGCRLCFINDKQFIWVTGNQVSKDCICTFELQNQNYQENLLQEIKLIKNNLISDINLAPIMYDEKKNIMIVKHKCYLYFIKILNGGQLKIITQIKYESNSIQGALTNDGKYLVTWNKVEQKYNIYELFIN